MSDLNNFFSNKRIMTATSIPTEGKFRKGDIIVNIGPDADKDSMWICVEAGSPGVWKTIGEVDLSNYATKDDLEEAKQLGNNVKQGLTDALIARGFPVSVNAEENTFDYLFNQLEAYASFADRQSVYNVTVSAGQTLQLQNETRGSYNLGITNPNYIYTNWGDGVTDNKLSHTYSAAGTYTLATPYSFAYKNGVHDAASMNALTGISTIRDTVNSMRHGFVNAYNLTSKPICGANVTDMSLAYYHCTNMPGPAVCGNNVTNMSYAYEDCYKLTGSPVCGPKVTNMCGTYYDCTGLTGAPVCGANVTNMYATYYNCTGITGDPVCGEKVTDMSHAYQYATGLTGAPVCGANVTNMAYAYEDCYLMSGTPVCGANVTNMYAAYYNCNALRNAAVIGSNVKDAAYAYYNCRYINGTAPCSSNNITNLAYAFYYCYNITSPGNIGANVTNMAYTFYNCNKWTANFNMYIYSPNVTNAVNCFYNKYASRYINVHVPANSTTLNTFIKNTAAESILGKAVTWTHNASNKCYYNTTNAYRIRIYYTL